ncbi:GSCOCG00001381001-RA-CDS [Cotesia congregata]|nr:GSCOCG00001381001-RA-CDS [Cotesia congregata]
MNLFIHFERRILCGCIRKYPNHLSKISFVQCKEFFFQYYFFQARKYAYVCNDYCELVKEF